MGENARGGEDATPRRRRRLSVAAATAAAVAFAGVTAVILRQDDESGSAPEISADDVGEAFGPEAVTVDATVPIAAALAAHLEGRTPPTPCDAPPLDSADGVVLVSFHCDAEGVERGTHVVAVNRPATADAQPLEAAISQLLGGPSDAEKSAGFYSPFSAATADFLIEATMEDDGHAVIDLDERLAGLEGIADPLIAGLIQAELTATAFNVPNVTSLEFRLSGDRTGWCRLFFSDCAPIERVPSG